MELTLHSSIYPVDVIKSKLQTDALDPAKRQYKGMIDCVSKVWRTQGWRGFTGGLGPTLIRYVSSFGSPTSFCIRGRIADSVNSGHHSPMELHSSLSSLPCGPWHRDPASRCRVLYVVSTRDTCTCCTSASMRRVRGLKLRWGTALTRARIRVLPGQTARGQMS